MKGVKWTIQEATEKLFPFINASYILTECKINNKILNNPEFMIKVMSTDDNEKIVEALYSTKTDLEFKR